MAPPARFTPRELEVAAMLADGYMRDGIAAELGLSRWTVASYMKALRLKTANHTITGAIAELIRDGYIR